MRLLAALLVLTACIHVPATAAAAREDTRMERLVTLEADVVRTINRERAARGLKPLRATPSLRVAARTHSRAMLDAGFFGHDSKDGTSFSDRIRRFYTNRGWQTWSVGEALLATEGQATDAESVVAAWLDSPPHRAIILSPAFRDVGIGAFHAATAPGEYQGQEAVVVTADFGLRTGRILGGDA